MLVTSAPDKGRSIAQGMYAQNADIIFHASGGTGNGVFQEAKSLNESGDKKFGLSVLTATNQTKANTH